MDQVPQISIGFKSDKNTNCKIVLDVELMVFFFSNSPINHAPGTFDEVFQSSNNAGLGIIKESGLIRELSFNSKPIFYLCTAFRQPRPLPEGALSCHRSGADCIVYYKKGGATRDISIVYDFYFLAARWTMHSNN